MSASTAHTSIVGGPVAIITGAGTGIGREAALLLSKRGFRLTLVGRREEKLREVAALIGTPALVYPGNVANQATVTGSIDATVEKFGRLDVLVNNAGYAPIASVDKKTPAMLREIFEVNALAPATATAHAWPVFMRQKSGRVIGISSYATVDPFPGLFAYSGAKAAVNMMAKSVANEGRPHNIKAFAIAPGAVETDMLRRIVPKDVLPTSRTLSPVQVAEVIVQCAIGERDAENGKTILLPSP